MSLNSTSIGWLNGDLPLSPIQKITYFALNWLNNAIPNIYNFHTPTISDFRCRNLKDRWKSLDVKSSPSRKLSDLFWLELPWEAIHRELGSIHVLDVGCGAGGYGTKLLKWSGNKISNYTGFDLKENKNWRHLEADFQSLKFQQLPIQNIAGRIPTETNFIMSQSAIEHFPEDLSFFRMLSRYVMEHRQPILQVHLFPSSSCLANYRMHGIRQYTPRTVAKITALYKDFSCSVLFRLGGEKCNKLHRDFITTPLFKLKCGDWRNSKTTEYDRLSFAAIEQDMQFRQKNPSFYALAIHSHWKKKIFV
jgi:SAM-dependent methyltransferase